jgi:hypothetical protein
MRSAELLLEKATPSRYRLVWRALTRAWTAASCSGLQTMLIEIVGCTAVSS